MPSEKAMQAMNFLQNWQYNAQRIGLLQQREEDRQDNYAFNHELRQNQADMQSQLLGLKQTDSQTRQDTLAQNQQNKGYEMYHQAVLDNENLIKALQSQDAGAIQFARDNMEKYLTLTKGAAGAANTQNVQDRTKDLDYMANVFYPAMQKNLGGTVADPTKDPANFQSQFANALKNDPEATNILQRKRTVDANLIQQLASSQGDANAKQIIDAAKQQILQTVQGKGSVDPNNPIAQQLLNIQKPTSDQDLLQNAMAMRKRLMGDPASAIAGFSQALGGGQRGPGAMPNVEDVSRAIASQGEKIGTAGGEDQFVQPQSYAGTIKDSSGKTYAIPTYGANPGDVATINKFNDSPDSKLDVQTPSELRLQYLKGLSQQLTSQRPTVAYGAPDQTPTPAPTGTARGPFTGGVPVAGQPGMVMGINGPINPNAPNVDMTASAGRIAALQQKFSDPANSDVMHSNLLLMYRAGGAPGEGPQGDPRATGLALTNIANSLKMPVSDVATAAQNVGFVVPAANAQPIILGGPGGGKMQRPPVPYILP